MCVGVVICWCVVIYVSHVCECVSACVYVYHMHVCVCVCACACACIACVLLLQDLMPLKNLVNLCLDYAK